jgi:putative aldouronate transport system substrate-binding protein
MDDQVVLSRRGLARCALGITAVGAAAACGGSTASTGTSAPSSTGGAATASDATSSSSGASVLPVYIPYQGVKPDFPAANQYSVAGFLNFPNPPVEVSSGAPGRGGTVTVSIATQAGTPASVGSNSWWQAVNERLGVDLKLQMAPAAQYQDKLAVMVAGGDIPDLTRMDPGTPNMNRILPARFADLTEHLSGDAIKDYPLLANFPTETWKSAVFGGAIYGVPMPLLLVSNRLVGRADIMDSLNVSPDVADAEGFLDLCQALTSEKESRWAMAQPTVSSFVAEMVGVPNDWRVVDGKFTKDIETDEYKQALDFIKSMWGKGYFHPDSFSGTANPTELFKQGRVCMLYSGGAGIISTYNLYVAANPDLRMAFMPAPKFDGGGLAGKWLGRGNFGLTAINKNASGDRIKELLSILNVLAGPFGTASYLLTQFGAEGADYRRDDSGRIISTDKAPGEKIPVNYLPGTPTVYYSGGFPDVTQAACEYEAAVTKNVVPYPTVGLTSETDLQKGASLAKIINDAANDVIQGRKQLTSWDSVVSSWRKAGGDQIRREYEEAHQ